jgi:cellulose synthase/poly-beta-1,6-N-acetylglucosamine synthase-like glycosyltransferase
MQLLAESLNNQLSGDFKFVVCDEKQKTKYKKLLHLLKNDDSAYFLSIDIDMSTDIKVMLDFVSDMLKSQADIGWGQIRSQKKYSFVSTIISIDKLVSHTIIRPFLWKAGIGISIPGQCFWIKRSTFADKLPSEIDTFLDDLALGLYINQHKISATISKKVLGYEIPNITCTGLWKQRTRWATGYASLLVGANNFDARLKIILHGIAYHGLWIVHLILCVFFFHLGAFVFLAYILVSALFIVKNSIYLLVPAIVYPFFMAFFHVQWFISLQTELKRSKNGNRC